MSELAYGLEGQEELDSSVEDVVESVCGEAYVMDNEPATLDAVQWPIRVHVFKRVDVTPYKDSLAENALEAALECLDEFSDPDGKADADITDNMRSAAKALAEVVVKEFVPWSCEATGQVIEVTREMVERDQIPDGPPEPEPAAEGKGES